MGHTDRAAPVVTHDPGAVVKIDASTSKPENRRPDRAALIAWVKQEAHSWKQQAKDDGVHERHSGMVYAERQHQHFDAIASLLEAEAWQPIATAPKDGTPILRPHIIWGAMDVRYATKPVPVTPLTAETNWVWLNGDYTTAWPETAFHPFWRPLPAPPVTEAKL